MKKFGPLLMVLIIMIVLLMFIEINSGGEITTFDERCQRGWNQMDVDPGDEGTIVSLILNREHAPDSVGAALQECIREGWDGWR